MENFGKFGLPNNFSEDYGLVWMSAFISGAAPFPVVVGSN